MASTAAISLRTLIQIRKTRRPTIRRPLAIAAAQPNIDEETNAKTAKKKNRNPGMDTRIHWDSPDEGWIGGKSRRIEEKQESFSEKFSDLIDRTDSHYQFLGIPPEADQEEIKAAFRRLSKEYHPDTTSLPLKSASDKFMRLREAYNVLSNEESRRFYDWGLAQESVSRRAEKLKLKLEDPYEQDVENFESVPDMVDRLGGKNIKLSDQAMTALTIDIAIIIFSICCIIYVAFFKEPY
ncbi:hypothetical protein AMTRI_Chr11g157590 [Amborella trichopoda]